MRKVSVPSRGCIYSNARQILLCLFDALFPSPRGDVSIQTEVSKRFVGEDGFPSPLGDVSIQT